MEIFYTGAGKIMAAKGEQAAKLWQALIRSPEKDLGGSYEPPTLSLGGVSKDSVTPMHSSVVTARLPSPRIENIFDLIHDYLSAKGKFSLFPPSKEEAIDKMGRLTHVLLQKGIKVYDELEKMIDTKLDLGSRGPAKELVEETKLYLDAAYMKQLHDKDELWARPRGPWGKE